MSTLVSSHGNLSTCLNYSAAFLPAAVMWTHSGLEAALVTMPIVRGLSDNSHFKTIFCYLQVCQTLTLQAEIFHAGGLHQADTLKKKKTTFRKILLSCFLESGWKNIPCAC